jgi:hypothetical protein
LPSADTVFRAEFVYGSFAAQVPNFFKPPLD